MSEHDSSYKYLFSHPEMVRDLILGFVSDEWLHGLDYSTLEPFPNEYISDDFRRRSDDVIWRVKVGGSWVYLYFLIEFQSSVDKYMALRVMVYLGLLYQDLLKHGALPEDGLLPPVLPIVLYNGTGAWRAAQDVSELIASAPGLVAQFKPRLKYFLLDEQEHSASDLVSQKNLVAAIFRFEHGARIEDLTQIVDLLGQWLKDQPRLSRMLARWLRASLRRKSDSSMLLPEIDDLQELRVMLAERFERWTQEKVQQGVEQGIQQGIQQGRQEGIQQGLREGIQIGVQNGEALALQRLLTRRFGALPAAIITQIGAASLAEIEAWFDLAIDAPSLEAVFGASSGAGANLAAD